MAVALEAAAPSIEAPLAAEFWAQQAKPRLTPVVPEQGTQASQRVELTAGAWRRVFLQGRPSAAGDDRAAVLELDVRVPKQTVAYVYVKSLKKGKIYVYNCIWGNTT